MGIETLAIASIAMGAASTGLGVMGQMQQAGAAAANANYQAQIAQRNQQLMQMNAGIQEQNAKDALARGRIAEDRQDTKTGLLIGAQKAALASQGGDVNSGSPLDIMADTARAGTLDTLTIRNNATREAFGYRVAAAGAEAGAGGFGAQAGLFGMQAGQATAGLPYGIGSSLLSGASSIAGKWAAYQNMGGGGGSKTGDFLNYGGTAGPAW